MIWRGSSDALSKKRTRVGETTIASNATIPELPFSVKVHWGAWPERAVVNVTKVTMKVTRTRFICFVVWAID